MLACLASCGSGDDLAGVEEALAHLITARFAPSGLSVPRGATLTVDLEVLCDYNALLQGSLGIRGTLDPQHRLPDGLRATFVNPPEITGSPIDANGVVHVPCAGSTGDPNLRVAHLPVRVEAAAGMAPTSATLLGFVEIEPERAGGPSKDTTLANLAVTVTAGSGGNTPGS
jgi:hypothetical protein